MSSAFSTVSMKKKVLFICTHNSARSQRAEGLLNYLYGSKYEAFSADAKPSIVNPYAIKSMAEIGIDISKHRSKSIEEFSSTTFDCVVTVCDNAWDPIIGFNYVNFYCYGINLRCNLTFVKVRLS